MSSKSLFLTLIIYLPCLLSYTIETDKLTKTNDETFQSEIDKVMKELQEALPNFRKKQRKDIKNPFEELENDLSNCELDLDEKSKLDDFKMFED